MSVKTDLAELAKARIEYLEQGQGEPVVMLPGGSLNVTYMQPLADALAAAGYRVIRINPRRAGHSTGSAEDVTLHTLAADVAGVVRHLGLDKVHILGHAFGNRVARTFAADYPALTQTVILLAAGGKIPPGPEAQKALRTIFDPNASDDEYLAAMRYMVGDPADVEAAWAALKPSRAPQAAPLQAAAAQKTPLEDWWAPPGKAPYLILQGTHDQAAPPENGELLKQDLGDRATLTPLEGAGHLMLVTRAGQVTQAIVDFLAVDQARNIAKEAYIFAYPMLENYKTMYSQAVDAGSSGYLAPFNRFAHFRQLLGPEFTEIVAPNNDTLYSLAWLDLGTEPLVLQIPDFGNRYFVVQMVDMYTHNIEYIGARTTGFQGGTFLLAGPGWEGQSPEGLDVVRRSESRFVFLLERTAVSGPDDVANVHTLQDRFELMPLSDYLGRPAPDPAPLPDFPPYDADKARSIEFIGYLNFLMQYAEIHPTEEALFARFARIGIGPGQTFDAEALDPARREAIAAGVEEGHRAIQQASMSIGREINHWTLIGEGFGYRSMMQGKYLLRAAAAMRGLYGNNPEEAYNFMGPRDADGDPLDASRHRYVIHFQVPPPVRAFWSISMYKLPETLFVENPIHRYIIGDRTPGLRYNQDGSLDVYIQHESPGPERESNWLPAPNGPFLLGLRIYWPEQAILDGEWTPPPIQKAG